MFVGRLEVNKRRFRMRDLTADLFISLDGFASGVNQAAYFGYFGQNLGDWVRDHLEQPQVIITGERPMWRWLSSRHPPRMNSASK
jgi:hypothetical protein